MLLVKKIKSTTGLILLMMKIKLLTLFLIANMKSMKSKLPPMLLIMKSKMLIG